MLTAILGYSELLPEQIGPDKPIGRDLQQIQAAAERAADSDTPAPGLQREAGAGDDSREPERRRQRVEPMLRRLLGERITIVTDLADDLGAVTADISQLEHLLINLAVNARDAMPHGGELRFTTVKAALDAAFAANTIPAPGWAITTPSGSPTAAPACPPTSKRRYSSRFYDKERGQGTGLGLAAVYGTVKQFGGYIDVESEPGRGTSFTIYLPQVESVVAPAPAEKPVSSPVGHETILLVEDESSVRAFAKITLQRFGYHVIEADCGERALEVLMKNPEVHLLLADVVLPRMDGPELAERVTLQRPGTRVLLMSGYAAGFENSAASGRWSSSVPREAVHRPDPADQDTRSARSRCENCGRLDMSL